MSSINVADTTTTNARMLHRNRLLRQTQHQRPNGLIAQPLVILILVFCEGTGILDKSIGDVVVLMLSIGVPIGIVISLLDRTPWQKFTVANALAVAVLLGGALYTLLAKVEQVDNTFLVAYLLPMVIVSASAETRFQRALHAERPIWIHNSLFWPEGSVECLVATWLIALGGRAAEIDQSIQALVTIFLHVMCSAIRTRRFSLLFLRAALITLTVASIIEQMWQVPSSGILRSRGLSLGSEETAQKKTGWPRAETLALTSMFLSPLMGLIYKETFESVIPKMFSFIRTGSTAEGEHEEEGEERNEEGAFDQHGTQAEPRDVADEGDGSDIEARLESGLLYQDPELDHGIKQWAY